MTLRNCRGTTLVELLVVITLISGAMGLCALTLTALFRTEQQLRQDGEQQVAAARLADQWRADAHAALALTTEKECVFTLPAGRSIRYAADGAAIRREVTEKGSAVHRDSFVLPRDAATAFAAASRDGREFAVLTVRQTGPGRPSGVPVREMAIEAVVNLHATAAQAEVKP
jgi:type II secretory pathway pseudopilin PulG